MIKTILIVILMFELLIIGHEFGHYITAKKVGITVHEFSVGMGPVILKKKKRETQYSLRAFPIGGFVAMEGEDEASSAEGSFSQKTIPQKMLVVSAGAIMNYLMAIVVLIIMMLIIGAPTNGIRDIEPGSAAEAAGLQPGDTILSIAGVETHNWRDVTEAIAEQDTGDVVPVEIQRKGETESLIKEVTVEERESGGHYIGIFAAYDRNLLYAVKSGVTASFGLIKVMFQSLDMLISGEASVKEVVGPIGIVSVMGDAASKGVVYVLYLTALISVNLAVVNLLPLPALDGGRLIFLIICGISRKPVNPELEGRIHYVGFILLLALMILVTVKDVNQFILH